MTASPTTARSSRRVAAPRGSYRAVYALLLRNLATRGRLAGVGVLGLFTIATGAIVGAAHVIDPLRAGTRFIDGGLTIFVPVGALVFASAAIGDLVDDGTLVYLWLRPLPARVPILAAYAAAVTICLPLIGVPMLISAVLVDGSADLVAGTAAAVTVAVLAYCALFTFWGTRIRRALPWGLAYILLWEGFVANAGKSASKLALRAYTRSVLSDTTGVGLRLAQFSATVGVVVPLVVAVVALALASRHLRRTDIA
ncbi:MAG: hypothetical protein JWM05_1174 [Acidimicrobiales bacterium]|nr:hypothetical protein [Acidimicrobiales bacterium]